MEHRYEEIILNGRVKLIKEATEFRMSIWIVGFGLNDALTDEEIIPLISIFNLDKIEEIGNKLRIKFRIYPDGATDYAIEVDPMLRRFKYNNEEYPTKDFYKTITGKEYE